MGSLLQLFEDTNTWTTEKYLLFPRVYATHSSLQKLWDKPGVEGTKVDGMVAGVYAGAIYLFEKQKKEGMIW